MELWWPIVLIVVSDVCYQVGSKSIPDGTNPFASLTLAYLVVAAASAALFLATGGAQSITDAWRSGNWAILVLGLTIVGLEAGSIYMFRAGWDISIGPLVKSSIIALALLVVGYLAYHETISPTKVCGVGAILVGLYLISR